MKKLLSMLIVAVMLMGMIPFAFAADTAVTTIALDEKKTVSVDRNTPVNTFEFTAPKTADYYVYSEAEDVDTFVALFDSTGKKVDSSDDTDDLNFGLHFGLEKGEKVIFKARCYNAGTKATYPMTVTQVKNATAIVPEKSTVVTYPGKNLYLYYSFAPIGAYPEYVESSISDESVLSYHGDNNFYALKPGTVTVTLKSDTGLSATVNVIVKERDTIALNENKTGKMNEEGVEYTFTPAETGEYEFSFSSTDYSCFYLKSDMYGYIGETNGMGGDFSSYLNADETYILGCYSHGKGENDFSMKVAKKEAVAATEIYIENEKGGMQPIEFSSELAVYGTDGEIFDEVVWSVDNPEIAKVAPTGYDNCAHISFFMPGIVVVTAKAGDLEAEYIVTGVRSPQVELDKEKEIDITCVGYETVYCFTPSESGDYIITVPDAEISVYGGEFYDGYNIVECNLEKDIEYHIVLVSYETEKTTIKVTKSKPATTVSFNAGEVASTYAHSELVLGVSADGNLGDVVVTTEGPEQSNYAYYQAGAVFVSFVAEGEYTLKLTAGSLTTSIKVIVKEYEEISFNKSVTFKLDGTATEKRFIFTPPADSLYTIKVTSDANVMLSGDFEIKYGTSLKTNMNGFEQEESGITVRLDGTDEANVTVTVVAPEFAKYMFPVVDSYTVEIGSYIWLEELFVFGPENIYENLTYTSSNEKVARVENYGLDPISKGTATITATSDYGLTASIKINVVDGSYDWADGIEIENREITLEAGKSEIIKATAIADTEKTIGFSSLEPQFARVDANGRVTGIAEGEASILVYVDSVVELVTVHVTAPKIEDTSKVFSDVKAGKWYTKAIDYAYSYGFIAGTSANEFGRETNVNRGMFITILARIAGVDTGKTANKTTTKFTDVKSGKYYTAAIKWANENGVVSGTGDKTFSPEASISRQDLCVMVTNFAKYMNIDVTASKDELKFKDASSISKYAKNAVKACQMAGIVNGYNDGTFGPKKTATRAEAAQILYVFHSTFIAK